MIENIGSKYKYKLHCRAVMIARQRLDLIWLGYRASFCRKRIPEGLRYKY